MLLLRVAERRIRLSDDLGTAYTVLLFGGLVVLAVAATIPRGGPIEAARDVVHSFSGAPIGTQDGGSLNARLFDASSNGRTELWTVALDEWRDHRLLGGGGGSFTAAFYARGDRTFDTENSHSLYLETLGRARHRRRAAGAAGGADAVRGRASGRGASRWRRSRSAATRWWSCRRRSTPTGSRRR